VGIIVPETVQLTGGTAGEAQKSISGTTAASNLSPLSRAKNLEPNQRMPQMKKAACSTASLDTG